MRALLLCVALWAPLAACAAKWEFMPELNVSGASRAGLFHHLDAAGRKNIALSTRHVAVIWEDNRSGSPQVYIAFKPLRGGTFTPARKLSTGQAAYEPVLVNLGGDRFVAAWEQDGRVYARRSNSRALGPVVMLSGAESAQVTLGVDARGQPLAAWAERDGEHVRIMSRRLSTRANGKLKVSHAVAVTPGQLGGDQAYPAVTGGHDGFIVAWEDTRNKSNTLLAAHSKDGTVFSPAVAVNEVIRKSAVFGEASTVARIGLATLPGQGIAAIWLDKRDYRVGYKVFSALSRDGGRSFGVNEKAQDGFGDQTPQWHAAIAAQGARMVAVWDDARDEAPGLWMAWRELGQGEPGQWSDNIAVMPASIQVEHTSPVAALDVQGNLHIAWVAKVGEISWVSYRMGRLSP